MPVATQRGGAEATLLHVLRHGRDKARWLVAFLEDGPLVGIAESLEAQAMVVEAGRVREMRRLGGATRVLARTIRAWRPDAVLSWMPKAHLYGGPIAWRLRLPSLWFQHGLPSTTDPIDRLVTLLPATGVLAPSITVAAAQAALWPHRHAHVAYPGVDAQALAEGDGAGPRRRLAALGVPDGAPVVGLVARLQRWKGVHVLIEALPELLRAQHETHVVVVGGDHPLEPGYREHLLGLAQRLGVAERVHLVGYQADGPAWMRAFNVVVHASDREPFGLVVLEAMALGKPLVAGAEGGPAEIIRDGRDGYLVPFGDARMLADRIGRLLADSELAHRIGAAAAQRAQQFTAERFAGEVLAALRQHVAQG
jgi:glycosyltransferase involved in cell wall biosynthesis